MFEEMNEKIRLAGVIATVTVEDADQAEKIAASMLKGNLYAMEITFRTKNGQEGIDNICSCIERIARSFPQILLGAGTVTSASLAKMAFSAGASYIVAPGFNPSTVDFCISKKLPVYPGVNNPSQIEAAMEKGLNLLKFFPAELSGGFKMLKTLQGPFPNISFIPTGGISLDNMGSYLKCPNVAAVGGSWMVKGSDDEIAELCKKTYLQSLDLKITDFNLEDKKIRLSSLSSQRALPFFDAIGIKSKSDEHFTFTSPSGFDILVDSVV